jgi:hypothetical protein
MVITHNVMDHVKIISRTSKTEKGKGHPVTCLDWHKGGEEVYLYLFVTLGLDAGGWSTSCPGRVTPALPPREKSLGHCGRVWRRGKTTYKSAEYLLNANSDVP